MTGWKRRQVFYAELAKLAEAGFGIREASRVMLDTKLPAAERQLLERMLARLDEGVSIAEAFGAAGISKLERSLIEAGERSGKPGPAFEHLADYFGMVAHARREALRAMLYPLVLLHLGLLLSVIPSDVMSGGLSGGALIGRLAVAVGVTWALIAAGVVAVSWLLRQAPGNASVDRALNVVPGIGAARRSLAMARFARVYHAGLLAGLPMQETVRLAGEASHSGAVAAAAERLAAAVKAGQPVGPAMEQEAAFPKAFARSYATAEESGSLDTDMARWAKLFATEATAGVKTLAVALPKLGYVLIVAFVVWKIFSFYSGYYGSLERIGE